MDDWFKSWFNTDEYLTVYSRRNNEEAKKLVDLILSTADIPQDSRVLDMACGAGRHSLIFARKNFKVTAVDLSEHLLAIAKSEAEKYGLKVNFVNSDLRCFSDSLKFALVVNLFTSLGYFENDEDNFKIIQSAYYHLEKSGYFVLDYFNKNYVVQNLVPVSKDYTSKGEIIQQRSIEGNRVIKKITIKNNGIEKHYHESVRLFQPDELFSIFERTGLKVRKVLGNFSGSLFEPESSPRIIIMAQK